MLTSDRLQQYRSQTFHHRPELRLRTKDDAIHFVNERGFVYFWPINGITFPSLWDAVAGDRPVPSEHDDPGHITWDWKDSLLGRHVWYYGKILRKKATFISLSIAPYFYALSENYGSPDEDYLTIYEQGRLTQEAKAVYEALLEHGPLDTITLKKTAHLTSQESGSRFERALSDLQADFKIMPVGVVDAGSWHYSFAYDLVSRHEPSLLENARFIGDLDARQKLLELYYLSIGAAQIRHVERLFGWKQRIILEAISRLVAAQVIQDHQSIEGLDGEWIALTQLL